MDPLNPQNPPLTPDLRPFFEMSLDLLCIAGFDGYFKLLNPAWEKTLGYSRAELTADPYLHFIHPDDRERTAAEATKLTTGVDTISFENRYRCKDGSYKWLLWVSTMDFEKQLLYAAARDITERKKSRTELERVAAELKRSNEALAPVLSGLMSLALSLVPATPAAALSQMAASTPSRHHPVSTLNASGV